MAIFSDILYKSGYVIGRLFIYYPKALKRQFIGQKELQRKKA